MRDNPKAINLSRRSVIAVLAAGAAANVPAIAALGAGAGADHPDAALLELGREYWRLDEAIKAGDAVVDAYREQEPVPRDVMRHRIEDHLCGLQLPIGPNTRSLVADLKYSALYSEDEIDQLRDWQSADPDEQARVEEILDEWDRWTEECGVLNEALGVDEATDAIEELVPKQRSLVKRIAATPATTLAGLRVRALILVDMLDDDEDEDVYTDQLMIRAIVRDLVKMAM